MSQPEQRRAHSALHRAMDDGHFKSIDYLLRMKVNPNVRDGNGLTPLMRCCLLEATPNVIWLIKALLKSGADPTLANRSGTNVLGQAINSKSYAFVKILLACNDINLHHKDRLGSTVFHKLADHDEKMTALVLEASKKFHISIDVSDAEDMTPIMLAAYHGNINVAKLFAQYGASLSARDTRWHLNAMEWYQLSQKRRCSHFTPHELMDPFGGIRYSKTTRPSTAASIQDSAGLNKTLSAISSRSSSGLNSASLGQRHTVLSSLRNLKQPPSNATMFRQPARLTGEPLLRYVFSMYESQLSRSFCHSAVPRPQTPDDVCGLVLPPDTDLDASFNDTRRRKVSTYSNMGRENSLGTRLSSPSLRGRKVSRGIQDAAKLPSGSPTLRENSATSHRTISRKRSTLHQFSTDEILSET